MKQHEEAALSELLNDRLVIKAPFQYNSIRDREGGT